MSVGCGPVMLGDSGETGDAAIRELRFSLFSQLSDVGTIDVGLALAPTTLTSPPGLALRPYSRGMAAIDIELRPRLTLKLEGEFDATGGLALERRPPLDVAFRIGAAAGGTLAATAGAGVQWGRSDAQRIVVFNLGNLLLLDFDGVQGRLQVRTDGSSIVLDLQLGMVDGAFTL